MMDYHAQYVKEMLDAYGRVEELEYDDMFAVHMASDQRGYSKHQVSEQEIDEVLSGGTGLRGECWQTPTCVCCNAGPHTKGQDSCCAP